MIYKSPTGTQDILPSQIFHWNFLENLVKKIFNYFNYREIRTPIFEETSLFDRGIGEDTDIVSKEMYSFVDRGQTNLTLRPEMTASVVRAFIEHSLDSQQPLTKLFYIGPMFRQERPQAGRFRQFHQFGAEAIGSKSPALDAEMILLSHKILTELGLKNLTVKVNSLGVDEERKKFKSNLKEFLTPHFNSLSEESKKRFSTNILRLFDSKNETDIDILSDAPLLFDYLGGNSINHINKVFDILKKAGVQFELDKRLVRGLDYYNHTTFEIISSKVGSQSALCGGGRYDGLIKELGDNDKPAVGFAAGIERILLAMKNENVLPEFKDVIDFYIISFDKNLENDTALLAHSLRSNHYSVEMDYLSRSVKAQMREANKMNAKYVLFIGGDEWANNFVSIKNMSNGKQINILYNELLQDIPKALERLNDRE